MTSGSRVVVISKTDVADKNTKSVIFGKSPDIVIRFCTFSHRPCMKILMINFNYKKRFFKSLKNNYS